LGENDYSKTRGQTNKAMVYQAARIYLLEFVKTIRAMLLNNLGEYNRELDKGHHME
jgi:hypothetical protein